MEELRRLNARLCPVCLRRKWPEWWLRLHWTRHRRKMDYTVEDMKRRCYSCPVCWRTEFDDIPDIAQIRCCGRYMQTYASAREN